MTKSKNSTTDLILDRRSALKLIGFATAATTALTTPYARAAGTPAKGGTLKIGLAAGKTSDSLDPSTYIDAYMGVLGFALGNCLVEIGPDKKLIPELAESWTGTNDAKTWIFKMRKGVTFHNGKPLSAADAAWSLNRHIGKGSTSAAKGLLAGVSSIKADGETVVIQHEKGDADIPIIMGDFHLTIVPEGTTDWSKFVGTGPYVLEEFQPGVSFKATRNPEYWKADRAWVDAVQVVFVTDPTARSNALLSGEVLAIDKVDTKIVNRLIGMDKFSLVKGVGGRFENAAMDTRSAPFNNNDVREAIKFGVDRKSIVEKIFAGYASIGNDHPIPETDPFFNTELPQRTYDPEKAKFHLKKAGMEGLSISLSTAEVTFPGAVDAAVLIQEAGKAASIRIDVHREPNDGYWDNVWMKKPFVMSNWSTRPTPGMMFSLGFACGAPWNETFFCDDKFTRLLNAGRVEIDFAKRKQIYWDMQELVAKNNGSVIFAFPIDLDAYAKTVQGTAPDGVNRMMGSRVAERVWLA